ncbi:MAG: methyltransferase domain-containing protein [Mycobacteriales bacterium]
MPNQTATTSLLQRLDTTETTPGARELRAHSYHLLRLAAGQAVADVGCGGGWAVEELAERGARPVGVDTSEDMVTAARQRWPGREFLLGSAEELPLADGSLAGYRSDKVFHDLAAPDRAVAEARRVLAPGGRIVLIDPDWDTLAIDSDDPALTRAIVHARVDQLPSPYIGRRLPALLRDSGFADVTIEVRTSVFTDDRMLSLLNRLVQVARSAGAVSDDRAGAWAAEQAERARTGRFFLAVPLYVLAATRA